MPFEFRMPDIGEGVVEGEVVRWLVGEGDVLAEDQPMVEVMTDKATVEVPSPRAGRVLRLAVPAGKTCKVGQVMLTIATEGEPELAPASAPAVAAPAVAARPAAPPPPGGKAQAAPAVRQLARELGVDLSTVVPTGPGGRVQREDVLAAAGRPPAPRRPATPPPVAAPPRIAPPPVAAPPPLAPAVEAPPRPAPAAVAPPAAPAAPPAAPPTRELSSTEDQRIPFRGVRRKIAERMAQSKRTAAHFTYVDELDATELVALRDRLRPRAAEQGVKLTFLPFFVKAAVSALRKLPIVNSTLDEEREEIVLRRACHIGVATASEAGLIVPVLRDADRKPLLGLAREIAELAEKVRAGKASREELTGSTFTITSLGAIGGLLATPIINYPEVAVMGVHKIRPTPVVRDGQVVVRQIGHLSISLDHRVVDGYEGALFLQHVISVLTDPALLLLELA